LTPELSPKQKPNPEPLTSGDSDFEVPQEAQHLNQQEDLLTQLREGLKLKPKEPNEPNLSNTLRQGLKMTLKNTTR
jgi:hypothetical protein